MKNAVTIFLLVLTSAAVFKSATPFLSYKANYEFIFTEMCEMRGTSNHNDCDGFCYLRKQIEHHDESDHEKPHTNKVPASNLYSSIFGIIGEQKNIESPFLRFRDLNQDIFDQKYRIYLDSLSPPPQS